jgi:Uncharacterized membrane protein, putative virulence factor
LTASTHEKPQGSSVFRSAGIVSIAVLMSRVTGLVREIVMAGMFGAGWPMTPFCSASESRT